MTRALLIAVAAGAVATGCTISDADRCPEGYVWNAQFLACECDVSGGYYISVDESDTDVYSCQQCADSDTHPECDTDTASDTGADTDADTDADAGADGGADTDTTADTGLGTECTSSDECAEFEADYCAISPLAPSEPGYCTFENCTPGSCPAPYLCCDLSALGYGIACLNEADATTAAGFGATCN